MALFLYGSSVDSGFLYAHKKSCGRTVESCWAFGAKYSVIEFNASSMRRRMRNRIQDTFVLNEAFLSELPVWA